ncbi:MAG TPA: hypothetical protein VHO03_08080 [Ignavibacteriales bacterium]|nr:hypothetical protein [Ignavibacteriales bacterium]
MISSKLEEYLKKQEEVKKNFLQELEGESPIIAKLYCQNSNLEIVDAQAKFQIVKIDESPLIIISDNETYEKVKKVLEKKYKPRKTYRKRIVSKSNDLIPTIQM